MIEVRDLTKRYGDKVAVDHLSFSVEPGRVTGFLGPNGAGKLTTMRLILGLDRPQAGTATIDGKRYDQLARPLAAVGALLEAKAMHTGRSAYNHLLFLAQSQGLPARRVDEVLALVGLTPVAHKRTGGYSLGMSQRVGIAAALLGNPPALLLDEPVNGLDPEGILWVRNLMKQLAAEGRTIFVSSHLMNEMAVTADHLIVIGKGKLIAESTTQEFIERSSERSVLVRSPQADRLSELITTEGGVVKQETNGTQPAGLSVTGMEAPRIGELAAAGGIVLHELTPRHASLEEAFMELTAGSAEFGAPPRPGPGRRGRAAGPRRRRRPARTGPGGGDRAMTAVAPAAPTPAVDAARRVGFSHLLMAEWTKIRSVRSTLWTLVIFAVVSLGLTGLITWLTIRALNSGRAGGRSSGIAADPVNFILGTGLGLGQLAICVLGVLVITSEYSSGTIRASLLATPRRYPMLIAKGLVFGALVFVIGEAVAFGSFFIGAAIVHSHFPVALSQPGVTRAVIGSGLYLTVLGLFALAIGSLIRHTAGAVTTVIGLVLVIFNLTGLLPYSWGAHIHAYMPTVAGVLITQDKAQAGQLLSPWQGFGVFCAWTALLLIVGGYLLQRRDA